MKGLREHEADRTDIPVASFNPMTFFSISPFSVTFCLSFFGALFFALYISIFVFESCFLILDEAVNYNDLF